MGYCQGMSDLVAPLLTEVQDESDTFWCFVGLMENTIFISSPRDEDMERQLVRGPRERKCLSLFLLHTLFSLAICDSGVLFCVCVCVCRYIHIHIGALTISLSSVPDVPEGAVASDAAPVPPAPDPAGGGRPTAAVLSPLAPTLLQTGVPRHRGPAYVGGLLGTLPGTQVYISMRTATSCCTWHWCTQSNIIMLYTEQHHHVVHRATSSCCTQSNIIMLYTEQHHHAVHRATSSCCTWNWCTQSNTNTQH
jgi:hypothetical protein